ncbi:GntR family transcriptional regulator [Runella rosea]|uniref:GntR family transcriptional regulator n=1 Tax=Runella rosea TaxID=2259595 RepID=A0A344TCK2_9BACT|nr:S1-like domain-containing RNA-binding protein [Runella rosea]AXE16373.1 GntR family transcriptional regulator [Runella rosea]
MGTRRLRMGQYNRLQVVKRLEFGIYLDGYEDEILVPTRYVPEGVEIGDYLDVFVYRDSEDRVIATTLEPYGTVGEFAYLTVNAVTAAGVFMDWGLPKDLFVPFKQQRDNMLVGKSFLVFIHLDTQTDRIVASAKIDRFLDEDISELKEGMEVELLPFEYTDLGIKALINQRHLGVLYHGEVFKDIDLGKPTKGYIKKIREDQKIDVALVEQSYNRIADSKTVLYEKLEAAEGHFLPFTDKSDPALIHKTFGMSKKDFKKAIGGLLKEGKIKLEEDGIHKV